MRPLNEAHGAEGVTFLSGRTQPLADRAVRQQPTHSTDFIVCRLNLDPDYSLLLMSRQWRASQDTLSKLRDHENVLKLLGTSAKHQWIRKMTVTVGFTFNSYSENLCSVPTVKINHDCSHAWQHPISSVWFHSTAGETLCINQHLFLWKCAFWCSSSQISLQSTSREEEGGSAIKSGQIFRGHRGVFPFIKCSKRINE